MTQVSVKPKVTYPFRRLIVLLAGMFLLAVGVVYSIEAALGTSTLSAVPLVISEATTFSLGTITIAFNFALVLLQILVLRKRYQPVQLLQLPLSIAFGLMIDWASLLIKDIQVQNLGQQWFWCFVGIVFTALGIGLEVIADLITMPAEGLIVAICDVKPSWKFSNVKIGMDVVLVLLAVVLSLLLLGRIEGVGLGTVAAAVFVGLVMKLTNKLIAPVSRYFLKDDTVL